MQNTWRSGIEVELFKLSAFNVSCSFFVAFGHRMVSMRGSLHRSVGDDGNEDALTLLRTTGAGLSVKAINCWLRNDMLFDQFTFKTRDQHPLCTPPVAST
jgi:hypothetical protein